MAAITEVPPLIPTKRPTLVWVISIIYVVSAGWTILSFVLVFSGAIPLNETQKAYFASQTIFDYGTTLLTGTANLVGAVLLFLLKKPAFYLFATAFCAGIAVTVYQIFAKKWLGAIGGPGLIGVVIGWGINIAIIVYSRRLISRGVLR